MARTQKTKKTTAQHAIRKEEDMQEAHNELQSGSPALQPDGARPLSFPVILAGFVFGILAVYLTMTFVYVKEQPLLAPSIQPNGTLARQAPQEGPAGGDGGGKQDEGVRAVNRSFTFEEVFDRLRDIDRRHKTDFRKENLRKQILAPARIADSINEVNALKDEINHSIINNETIFWLHLVQGRLDQLESERKLNQALVFGSRGFFSRNVTESCERYQTILEAAVLFNQSARFGGRAMYHFDETLTQEKTWPVLGINDQRMAFYSGDTRDLGALANSQVEKVRAKCLGLPPDDPPRVMKTLEQVAGNGTTPGS